MNTKIYHYTECGLDYIYLKNGFTYHETPYGKGVSFFAVDTLNEVIAREIVTSPRPLRGQEVRFLRSLLDVSQSALARILGVTRITVTRWETKPDSPILGTADAAMRLLYSSSREKGSLIERTIEMLRERDEAEPAGKIARKRVTFATHGNGWDTANAA